MSIAEKLPTISDKEIDILRDNALRLQESGDAKQRAAAEQLLPLIEEELATRLANKPPPASRAKKAVAKKPAKAKKVAEAE